MALLAASRLFTGWDWLGETTLRIENGRIAEVIDGVAPGAIPLAGDLAPGLVDVQVNGGGGAMFNDAPTLTTLRTITAAHAKLGVTAIMATLISDEREKIPAAIVAVERGIADKLPGLLGLHLEGPWLAAPRRGVHPERFLRPLDATDMALLARPRPFPVVITLAPERASPAQVSALVAAGVTVSIGHTAADHEAVSALLAAGASGFTHLFNAMPPLEGRKPGPVGVALASPDAFAGLILDGVHVHPLSARAAFAAKTARRLALVSDAMASVGAKDQTMTLFGEAIAVAGGALRTASGTLAGAHLDLAAAVRNAVKLIGASPAEALMMATSTPAAFLGQGEIVGSLRIGARADLILLDPDLNVRRVWIAGEEIR